MMNWFVRDEMKVMGTDDQQAGERKLQGDSRRRVKHGGKIGYLLLEMKRKMVE